MLTLPETTPPVSPETAKATVRPSRGMPDHAWQIICGVAAEARLDPNALLARPRPRRIAWPRFIAMHRLRAELKPDGTPRYSLPKIARFFGLKDHTGVLHALGRVERGEITITGKVA